jgi:hypothetical protein
VPNSALQAVCKKKEMEMTRRTAAQRSITQDAEELLWLLSMGVMALGSLAALAWFVGRTAGFPFE